MERPRRRRESAADDHARVRGGVQPGARHWRCYPGAVHLGPAGLQRALRGGGAAAAAEGVDAEASGDAARAAHGLGGSRCWQGKQVGGRPSARDRGRPPSMEIGDQRTVTVSAAGEASHKRLGRECGRLPPILLTLGSGGLSRARDGQVGFRRRLPQVPKLGINDRPQSPGEG